MAKASSNNLVRRRRIRELEAQRDRLLIAQAKARETLVKTRAELKHVRGVA